MQVSPTIVLAEHIPFQHLDSIMPAWFLTVLCPTIGLIITTFMWLSPMQAILEARHKKDLQNMNPLPFAFMVINCIGWVIYGLVTQDMFVFWSNITGLLLGMFYVMNVMSILSNQTKPGEPLNESYRTMEILIISAFAFWSFMSLIATSAHDSESAENQQVFRKEVVGTSVLIFNILYYAAPLSTVIKIIKLRDSSSILGQMVLVNLINALMWFVYGVALSDVNISVPNGMGIALALLQLVILLLFRKPVDSLCTQDVEMVSTPLPSGSHGLSHQQLSMMFSKEHEVYSPHSDRFVKQLGDDHDDNVNNNTYKYETIHF